MIIFLYGPDSFRSKKKLDEIILHYKNSQKSGVNLIVQNAPDIEFSDFFHQCKVSSMFAEKKLIVLKNLFSNKSFHEDFQKEIKNVQNLKDVVVVYESDAVDERLKIFKTLTAAAKTQGFTLLDNRGVKTWAQKEFEKNGQKINADALDLLVSWVGNDLWRLSSEIKKLTDFSSVVPAKGRSYGGSTVASGEGGKNHHRVINIKDVELLVKPKFEVDIFKTIDAFSSKNRQQAFMFLKRHLDQGENPLYLLSMVAYQLKNLLIVKELAEKSFMYDSIVKKSGLHPFVVKKNYFACQQFSLETLKKTYHNIFAVDYKIKTGQLDPETALDILFSQI